MSNALLTRRVTEAVTLPRPDPTRPDPLVGFACIVSTGSASRFARGRLVPADACTEILGGW